MCRCGISGDLIYRKLEEAEIQGAKYNLSVDVLFPEDEMKKAENQEND